MTREELRAYHREYQRKRRRNRDSEFERMKKKRDEQKFMMRVRLAKRDLDYAESPCAARVTVEERGNIVVETRGRCCIAPRITHLCKC